MSPNGDDDEYDDERAVHRNGAMGSSLRAFGLSLQKDNYLRHPYHRLDGGGGDDDVANGADGEGDDCGDVELGAAGARGGGGGGGGRRGGGIDPSSTEDSEDYDGNGDLHPLLSSPDEGDDDDEDHFAHAAAAAAAGGGGNGGRAPHGRRSQQPRVYPWRWIQLTYLSLLALLSDWVCFSTASVPRSFASAYPGRTSEGLIDLFLLTNVLGCVVVTDAVSRFGLRRCIRAMSALMMVGCWLRAGLGMLTVVCDLLGARRIASISSFLDNAVRDVDGRPVYGLPTYPYMAAGTILVGFAQPFFQCTPPLLSATWFASNERATSSAIALNFNQVGIAAALVVGGWMVDGEGLEYNERRDGDENNGQDYSVIDHYRRTDEDGIDPVFAGVTMMTRTMTGGNVDDGKASSSSSSSYQEGDDDGLVRYLSLVAMLSTILCVGTCRHFRDAPPVPPSASEMGKANIHGSPTPFYVSVRGFLRKRGGFGRPLVAFVYSIAITNVVGAFIEEVRCCIFLLIVVVFSVACCWRTIRRN
jgi:hypothetical protein